ncbi:hypothetical protein KSS87_018568 [Heliosperma pusillum]|nr:hypothetical protein KSS87_018568 [Heliosperma pusillum]
MAVSSSPVSASKKMETKKPQKRTKCPGVRVVGGRIYDSQNGKTCHQCRQKTMDITARCKNMKNEKQCTIMFCHKCLLNRYGENAEEMATCDDWHCPKCRDICNCSFCMKKKGHQPTGILVHTAKATGFSSVSQLLNVKGPNVSKEVVAKGKVSSPKETTGSAKDHMVSSPKKRGKENSSDETCKMNSNTQNLGPNVKKAKKTKKDIVKEKDEVPTVKEIVSTPKKDNVVTVLRRSPRKFLLPHESKQDKPDDKKTCKVKSSPKKSHAPQVDTNKEDKMDLDNGVVVCVAKKEKKTKVQAEGKTKKNEVNVDASIFDDALNVALPPGTLLTNVAGIELLPQDGGYVLQFLEFCSSFGEVLKIRKGQPENVLRDILCGRRRRFKSSSSAQFITHLLSFMEVDSDEQSEESPASPSNDEDSCTLALRRYLAQAVLAPEDIPEDWFDKGSDRYELLDSSQKLRLLTFLCDETLSTVLLRDCIEEQNLKFIEEGKEAKESLNAAKEKEKLVKRKLQEDIAKALMAKNGAPLTLSEHDSIVSEIKAETKRVQEEISNAMGVVSKKRLRSDAARTEPIILDDDGRVYWRLKGLGDASLLLQDVGGIQEVSPNDKWFSFDDDEMKIVEKYISAVRLKRHRSNKLADEATKKRSGSGPERDSSSNDDSAIATTNS